MTAAPVSRTASSGVRRPSASLPPGRTVEAYLLFQVACQLMMVFGGVAELRTGFRVAAFGASLGLLVLLPARSQRHHPARRAALWALLIVAVAMFHPSTNTAVAGAAQLAMYTAILAPLFWVPGVAFAPETLRRALLILWSFNLLGAVAGVLQVAYPGSFQPALSPRYAGESADYLRSLQIASPGGAMVFRPMGLTDIPGGATIAGFYTALLGFGFFLTERRWVLRLAGVFGAVVGFACMYLAQVRATLVVAAVSAGVLVAVIFWHRDLRRALAIASGGVLASVVGVRIAAALGGPGVLDRVLDLLSRPTEVYYGSRGGFLQHTFETLLPRYPFGAGLGRWGMINAYFGESSDPVRAPIWVEIQWTGWLVDGGIPLMAAYVAAVVTAIIVAWRIARRPDVTREVALWALVILAYDVGILALTFSYPVFMSQIGMEFWLLNALLFSVALAGVPPEPFANPDAVARPPERRVALSGTR